MKLGILGTGMIVKDMLTTIHKLKIESVSILGTEKSKNETQELAKKYGISQCYFNYDEMLLKSDTDTIYVALPNSLHYEFAKKALEHGKHVIIEKPITANYSELRELKKIAAKNNRMIFEGISTYYLPAYILLKEKIPDLGSLKIVSLNYSQYSSRYDAFKEGNILPAFDSEKAGGALMDINVYNIHTVIGLFGKPISVDYKANIEKNIDTSGILTMDYGLFQVVCIGAKDCKAPIVSSYQGDEGNIIVTVPPNGMRKFTFNDKEGNSQEYSFNEEDHRLLYEFQEFIKMIDGKDYDRMNRMLERSSLVSQVMEEARKKAGIVFANDM